MPNIYENDRLTTTLHATARVIKKISDVALDGVVDSRVQENVSVPKNLLSEQEFIEWAKGLEFSNGRRGTYNNGSHFLYIKSCHQIKSESDVTSALTVARSLTEHGILHPDTQWGVYQMQDYFQLFPVSPKIEPVTLDALIETDSLGNKFNTVRASMFTPAIVEWMQRLDSNFQPEQVTIPATSPLRLLNVYEASHPDNWGIDTDGTLYPVDTEVVHLSGNEDIIREIQSTKS